MGLVVIEGLVILVLVLTGFRRRSSHAVPAQLKITISVGIGLFIALIGFVDAGFVRRIPDAANTTVPVSSGQTGQLAQVAGAGVRSASPWSSCSGAPRAQRDPLISIAATTVLAIVVEAIVGAGRSSTTPRAGASTSPPGRTRSWQRPTSGRSASSAFSDPSRASAWSRRCCSSSR